MTDAIGRSEHWWQSTEVIHVFPNEQCVADFLEWLRRFQLGRKRLLDTLLASTLRDAGVRRFITNNERHFRVFGCFELVTFHTAD